MIAFRGELEEHDDEGEEITLAQYLAAHGHEGLFVFESSIYDRAFAGVSEGRAVYSYELMVDGLMECGFSEEEARTRIDAISTQCVVNQGYPIIVRSV